MAYASPFDLMQRYDLRDIGQLVADDGVQVSEVDLPTNANLLTILGDASGDIEAALMVAGLYTVDDLAGLTGNALAHLKRITCDVAMAYIYGRRPMFDPDKYATAMEIAEKHLERLRKGENVFNLPAPIAAGQPDVDGPTSLDFSQELNLIRDRTRNFYPRRRLPHNR